MQLVSGGIKISPRSVWYQSLAPLIAPRPWSDTSIWLLWSVMLVLSVMCLCLVSISSHSRLPPGRHISPSEAFSLTHFILHFASPPVLFKKYHLHFVLSGLDFGAIQPEYIECQSCARYDNEHFLIYITPWPRSCRCVLFLEELNAILRLELGSVRLQNLCLEEEREKGRKERRRRERQENRDKNVK